MQNRGAEAVPGEVTLVANLLGGRRVLHRDIKTPLDAHHLIIEGMPWQAVFYLFDTLVLLRKSESLESALGMSLRTFQRRKAHPRKPLALDQAGRAWKFAELLNKAITVFGSQEDAEAWFDRPAIGLDQNRPIDLLATPTGTELVSDHLDRLEYGVYT